ncbi:putative type I restriction enzyme S protein [Methanoculleus sp. CAG:1088]|nr:putative type I restriction enzyme S protein [Methanoculleus sp. CAG:1088]
MPPECWKTATLGDYAKVIMGQSPESQYYTTDCNNMPFLQGNRTFGSKYPSFDTYTTKVTKLAPKGSVIISVRAPVGDTNVAPSELCLGRGVAALQSEDPDNEFLYYLVKSLVPLMNQNENGSTFGSINRTDLEKLPIDLPDYEERYKIGQVLSALDSKIELNQQINAKLGGTVVVS